jgi:hypothetical protein
MATRDLAAAALTRCETGRWLLAAGTIRFTSALPADASAARDVPLATTASITRRDGADAPPPACFADARKSVRYLAADGLLVDDVAAATTPAAAGVAAWGETGDRFIAWHCIVVPRADGRWTGRPSLVALGWTIGSGAGERRVCRYVDANDANIAADDRDVGAALLGRNFVVVPADAGCPTAPLRTVQHQP